MGQLIKCNVPINEYVQNKVKKSTHKNYKYRAATVCQNSPDVKIRDEISSRKN